MPLVVRINRSAGHSGVFPHRADGEGRAGEAVFKARSWLLETLGQDYFRTARAKGMPERHVVLRHGLRSALVVANIIVDIAYPLLDPRVRLA